MIRLRAFAAVAALGLAGAACQQPAMAEQVVATPEAAVKANEPAGRSVAVLAGGCFWGMEAVFSHVKGVTSVVSGFEGGARGDARYERVSDGDTGHAEAVRITYDPAKVRYDELLRIFFGVASDPTQLNRQGPDSGTQYRNAIVPLNREQARVAAGYIAQLRALKLWRAPIVTAIEPDRGFFKAEDYHQDFMLANPNHGYIRRWDVPKVNALKTTFPQYWKPLFTRN